MKLLKIVLLLPVAGLLVAWAVHSSLAYSRYSRFVALVEEVRPLLEQAVPADEQRPPALRDKVLVWDLEARSWRDLKAGVPADLLARSADEPLTLVCVTAIRRDKTTTYNTGEIGYRQTATVKLVHWPEKKFVGSFTVQGQEPPWIAFVPSEKKGQPVLGDLDKPLASWITSLPREDSPTYQETLATLRLVQEARPLLERDNPEGRGKQPELRGKVLVWDLRTNQLSPVQAKLPPELQGQAGDRPLTVVGIVRARDEDEVQYQNGRKGYRVRLTIGLAAWPERRSLGQFEVLGDVPPLFLFGQKDDGQPIRGDFETKLKEWIVGLPRVP
jgi:hypothetical protein